MDIIKEELTEHNEDAIFEYCCQNFNHSDTIMIGDRKFIIYFGPEEEIYDNSV